MTAQAATFTTRLIRRQPKRRTLAGTLGHATYRGVVVFLFPAAWIVGRAVFEQLFRIMGAS